MIIIDKEKNIETIEFCPKCENHCAVEQFQCGKGRRWWNRLNDPNAEEDIRELFDSCVHIFMRRREKRHGQRRVMRVLKENGGTMNQRDLAKLLDVRAGSLSELLIKMEEKGLIERKKLETDRRNYSVTLCAKEEKPTKEHHHKDMFQVLSEEEKKQFASILKKLKEDWKEESEETACEKRKKHHRKKS